MNIVRKIGYLNDGVTDYQCLSCKEKFQVAHFEMDFNFCPYCGIKFIGGAVCREHWIPKWVYQRYGNNHGIPSGLNIACTSNLKSNKHWVIEERTKWGEHPWSEWKWHYSIKHELFKLDNWNNVYWYVKRYCRIQQEKEYDNEIVPDYQIEYRVRFEVDPYFRGP